jgi:small-conductance mechanosensitive channel
MADETTLRGVITFMDKVGVYDVVLPFLLVFTILFAVLERSKVLGTDDVDGRKITKKNLNAMVAFVIGFLVVASTKLVAIINKSLANMTLILILVVMFFVLIAMFFKEGEDVVLQDPMRWILMVVILIAILLIFFDSIGWLDDIGDFISRHISSSWFLTVVMLIFIVVFMAVITKGPSPPKKEKKE